MQKRNAKTMIPYQPDSMPWVVISDGRRARIMALQEGHAYLIEELYAPPFAADGLSARALAHLLAASLEEKFKGRLFSSLIVMASTAMVDEIYRAFSDSLRAAIIALAHKNMAAKDMTPQDMPRSDEDALLREVEDLSSEIGYQLAHIRLHQQL